MPRRDDFLQCLVASHRMSEAEDPNFLAQLESMGVTRARLMMNTNGFPIGAAPGSLSSGGSDQALIRRQSRCKRKANAGFQPLPHAWLVGEASAFRQGQTLSLDGERRAAKRPGRQREMKRLSGFFDEL